jgi:hypothetical protein
MSKRLSDTEKLQRPWFRKLSIEHKAFWYILLDLVDCAGVWRVDPEEFAFRSGHDFDLPAALKAMDGRVVAIDGGRKWHVVDFIPFQYGKLTASSRVHASVIRALQAHGIDSAPFCSGPAVAPALSPGVGDRVAPGVAPTPKEKDKDKDKEKEKEKEKATGGAGSGGVADPDPASVFAGAPVAARPTATALGPHEVVAFVRSHAGKVWRGDEPSWLRLADRYGLDELGDALDEADADDKRDFNRMEKILQSRRKRRVDNAKMGDASSRSRQREADQRSEIAGRKAKNAAAREPMIRLSDYLCDPATPDEIREKAAAAASVVRVLKDVREERFTALILDAALIAVPELRAIAYPVPAAT